MGKTTFGYNMYMDIICIYKYIFSYFHQVSEALLIFFSNILHLNINCTNASKLHNDFKSQIYLSVSTWRCFGVAVWIWVCMRRNIFKYKHCELWYPANYNPSTSFKAFRRTTSIPTKYNSHFCEFWIQKEIVWILFSSSLYTIHRV